jgi:nucleoside-diphosphate-sugar epimerase
MKKIDYSKIFLTGSTGWLGKQILQTLIFGDSDVMDDFETHKSKINCFVNKNDNSSREIKFDNHVNLFYGDIRNENDTLDFLKDSKNSLLIHTAAVIHPKDVKTFFEVNYRGTVNLIENGIKSGVKKFIVISSNSPIGCNKNNFDLFDQNSDYNPYMNYGKSKMQMEQYLNDKIHEGVDITIIRSPWFHGPFMPDRQVSFYRMIKNGLVPIIGNGDNLRSMANVKNITQGIILCSILPISKGKTYWIADRQSYKYTDIIDIIRNVLENEFNIKCKYRTIKLPFALGQFFQFADYFLQKFGIYVQSVHVLSELNKNIACSIDFSINELGYNPKVDLYNGIKDSLIGKNFKNLKLN